MLDGKDCGLQAGKSAAVRAGTKQEAMSVGQGSKMISVKMLGNANPFRCAKIKIVEKP